jgi:hypothetical protein
MTLSQLLNLEWKQLMRRSNSGVEFLVLGSTALMIILFYLLFLVLVSEGTQKLIENGEIDIAFWGFKNLLLAGIILFFLRLFFNTNLSTTVPQLYYLPISKNKLTNLLILRSFFDSINFLFIIFGLTFWFRTIYFSFSIYSILFFIAIPAIVLFIQFLYLHIARFIQHQLWIFKVIFILLFLAFAYSITEFGFNNSFTENLFNIIQSEKLAYIFVSIALISSYFLVKSYQTYFANIGYYKSFANYSYSRSGSVSNYISGLFSNNPVSQLVLMDIKLLLRSKRTKYMWIALIYPLSQIIPKIDYEKSPFDFSNPPEMGLVLITGFFFIIPMSIVGQMMQFNSSFFDGLHLFVPNIRDYFKAKLSLIRATVLIFILLISFVAFFDLQLLAIILMIAVYFLTFGAHFTVYLSTYFDTRFELNESPFFNAQGTDMAGMAFLLIPIPYLALVGIIYYFGGIQWMFYFTILVALTGVAFSEYFMKETIKNFNESKYNRLNGFRTLE